MSDEPEQDPPAPQGETKAEAFIRLGEPRVTAVLEKLRILGNLSASQYEYTEEQIDRIEETINSFFGETMLRFRKRGKEKTSFTF